MKNSAFFILAIWLIAQSILSLTKWNFPWQKLILPSTALAAGVLLLLHVLKTKIGNLGHLFLSLWLLYSSSLLLFKFSFPYSQMTVAILGMVTGVFLIIRK